MATSTLTDKGQTTVPQEIREALKVKPRQRLTHLSDNTLALHSSNSQARA
jgi:bifunctional DNA-binding transcriptional regulator/antitoxin component of YhaV-PrlF toxin-antitoxin module